MDYALIENGVVANIIWLYPQNADDFPNAVPMGDIPAGIGDTYEDGVFYRNGERVLTLQEQMQKEMQEALAETEAAEAAYREGVQEA
ncbi:MAG: hypothetical protein IKZ00_02990 [Bacteroidaceae bacterium]|nr:hypothetical protein [Bacteroidaceae bacterium]